VKIVESYLNDWMFSDRHLSAEAMSAIVLALVAISHLVLRWWIRRKARHQAAAEAVEPAPVNQVQRWVARALHEMLPPLALLIWINGLYAIARLLLADAAAGGGTPAESIVTWCYAVAVVAGLFWLLARLGGLLDAFLRTLASRSDNTWDDIMLPLAGKAARYLLPLLALILAAPALSVSPELAEIFGNAMSLVLIGGVAFVLLQVVDAGAALVLLRHRIDERDNLRARSIHTQVLVLKKVVVSVIVIFTLASMLMVFDSVRQFGASILASAGIAGIIVGLAAQRSIATLLAGFQIAVTQPIRVDDVVIVENEWGRIEDITLTYVVVRIWDLRRLVLPITYFIEQPFQNWTRVSAELLGTIYLHVDYTVPLAALRDELTRILNASKLWDGKVNVLQVTEAKERDLELRALVSAADASIAWDLRCEVREKLIDFLQRNYPHSLPKVRASLDGLAFEGGQAAAG
jgi:small-conductance mechanosensitive channel